MTAKEPVITLVISIFIGLIVFFAACAGKDKTRVSQITETCKKQRMEKKNEIKYIDIDGTRMKHMELASTIFYIYYDGWKYTILVLDSSNFYGADGIAILNKEKLTPELEEPYFEKLPEIIYTE